MAGIVKLEFLNEEYHECHLDNNVLRRTSYASETSRLLVLLRSGSPEKYCVVLSVHAGRRIECMGSLHPH